MKNFVILPTYNESKNIAEIITEIFKYLPEINILVVDDNSPDNTAGIIKNLQSQYTALFLLERSAKDGLGGAYIAAFKKLFSDNDTGNVIMMDADFSHNPKYLPQMLEEIKNYDLVIGSRYIKGGGVTKWEMWRRLLSRAGNFYARLILGSKINDWTGGFNCISTQLCLKPLCLKPSFQQTSNKVRLFII